MATARQPDGRPRIPWALCKRPGLARFAGTVAALLLTHSSCSTRLDHLSFFLRGGAGLRPRDGDRAGPNGRGVHHRPGLPRQL